MRQHSPCTENTRQTCLHASKALHTLCMLHEQVRRGHCAPQDSQCSDACKPGAGVSIQIRAAKTEADTSTWTGSNPVCASVNLTTDNLGKLIKCTQPMMARYLTVIGNDGDGLPICSLDAIISMPQQGGPNQAAVAPSSGEASGCPLCHHSWQQCQCQPCSCQCHAGGAF